MPLPLLVPIALGLAGLFGVGKTTVAFVDNGDANDLAESAQDAVKTADNILEFFMGDCNITLRLYGALKIRVLNYEVCRFVQLFSQLKNVVIENSPELDRLRIGSFTEVSLQELQHTCSFALECASGGASGGALGAVTAFGAYGGTMMLASAGTGTAISALSGAAATNATLAWLGGGTLAAGGYGVAGGVMALGTMVAGPALLVLGCMLGAKASQKLDVARTNMEKAKVYVAEVDVVVEKLFAISEVVTVGDHLLRNLQGRLERANAALNTVIQNYGIDYSNYSEEARNAVFVAVKYAQVIKKVIDTPILNTDGALSVSAMPGFEGARKSLDAA